MKIFYVCHDGDKKELLKRNKQTKHLWLYEVQILPEHRWE